MFVHLKVKNRIKIFNQKKKHMDVLYVVKKTSWVKCNDRLSENIQVIWLINKYMTDLKDYIVNSSFKQVVLNVGSLRWFQGIPSKKRNHLFPL